MHAAQNDDQGPIESPSSQAAPDRNFGYPLAATIFGPLDVLGPTRAVTVASCFDSRLYNRLYGPDEVPVPKITVDVFEGTGDNATPKIAHHMLPWPWARFNFYVSCHNHPKDSSVMSEIVTHFLTRLALSGMVLSQVHLHIQCDNTPRELKNNTLLRLLVALTSHCHLTVDCVERRYDGPNHSNRVVFFWIWFCAL